LGYLIVVEQMTSSILEVIEGVAVEEEAELLSGHVDVTSRSIITETTAGEEATTTAVAEVSEWASHTNSVLGLAGIDSHHWEHGSAGEEDALGASCVSLSDGCDIFVDVVGHVSLAHNSNPDILSSHREMTNNNNHNNHMYNNGNSSNNNNNNNNYDDVIGRRRDSCVRNSSNGPRASFLHDAIIPYTLNIDRIS